MDNLPKYYTPTIEEFHVGFEFEYLTPNGTYKTGNWKDKFIDHREVDEFDDEIQKTSHSICRVKYLDREDIESLGWVRLSTPPAADVRLMCFSFGEAGVVMDYFEPDRQATICIDGKVTHSFRGTIRNKSELARVMKMVGIKTA